MPRYRDRLPDDLKELIVLIRSGKLFAVQEWIAAGKRYTTPDGNFATTPFLSALEIGFHSMVEIFLKAGIDQDERDTAINRAVWNGRLDLIELLEAHGADPRTVDFEDVISARNPLIIRWFIAKGMDLVRGFPIAYAFRYKHREFLGIYMRIRDTEPSARLQAAMALRFHSREGSLKWVSLLLWAGANPRAKIPCLDNLDDPDYVGSALKDAVKYGKVDVVRKIKLDPQKDDMTELLGECWMCDEPLVVEMLLQAGADPNGCSGERNIMDRFIRHFAYRLHSYFGVPNPDPAVCCIELAAAAGGRWKPPDPDAFSTVRREIGRAESRLVMPYLQRIVASGAIEREVFKELMRTQKMKDILNCSGADAEKLRDFAGHSDGAQSLKTAMNSRQHRTRARRLDRASQ
jgi:hypothetical protein